MTVAEDALDVVLAGPRSRVAVTGPPGAGKSTTAQTIADAAAAHGTVPVLVSPPSAAADAGALALSSVIRQLGGRPYAADGWSRAQRKAATLLQEAEGDVLVICDEPSRWGAGAGHFARRGDDVADLLVGPSTGWRTVILDQAATGVPTIPLPQAVPDGLVSSLAWDELANAAAEVAASPTARDLNTPLKQRLAVAIAAWDPEGAPHESPETSRLALRLADVLANRRHGRALWVLWQRLALARIGLDDSALAALGGDDLAPIASATLRLVLLDGAGRLHDTLRMVPELRPPHPQLREENQRAAHETLFEHYFRQLADLDAEDPAVGVFAAEALHHAGELGDEERLDRTPCDLTDQWNAIGTRLGTVHKKHRVAGDVFLRAMQSDADDAYALHGRARNLDVLGEDLEQVEEGYRRALDREPLQPSWHADRIALYLDLGRIDEARRAWAKAETASAVDDETVYEQLHAPIATLLIARGELEFAQYVLDGVPGPARDSEHARLRTILAGRLAADDQGAFVPATRSGRRWWQEPPEALAQRDTDGRELQFWAAGRVEAVDDDGVHLHVAQVRDRQSEPEPAQMTVPFPVWQARCLDEVTANELTSGRFVEVGRYRADGEEPRTAIRVLPTTRLPPGRHEPLSPARWISS